MGVSLDVLPSKGRIRVEQDGTKRVDTNVLRRVWPVRSIMMTVVALSICSHA